MLPMLIVALMIWAGVFGFIFNVDRRVSQLEKQLDLHDGAAEREQNG